MPGPLGEAVEASRSRGSSMPDGGDGGDDGCDDAWWQQTPDWPAP